MVVKESQQQTENGRVVHCVRGGKMLVVGENKP
jgi:hypothetical protein